MRRARTITIGALCFLLTTTTMVSAGAAQPAPTTPELFDLDLAQGRLDAINAEIADLQNELFVILDQIDGLTIERDFLDLNQTARNDLMQSSRTRARNMAINAYVGIGPPLSGAVVLDAETANDLSYQRGLLRQQAERLQEASSTYSLLAGEVDANVLALSDTINDQTRRAEALNREINRQRAKLPEAEWHVWIATIHDEADEEFEKRGRAEPTAEDWRELRHCESSETYAIDTSNGFFGAYQFDQQTWVTVGGQGNPAQAHPAEQDARARLLYSRRGAQPWPICGRFLPN